MKIIKAPLLKLVIFVLTSFLILIIVFCNTNFYREWKLLYHRNPFMLYEMFKGKKYIKEQTAVQSKIGYINQKDGCIVRGHPGMYEPLFWIPPYTKVEIIEKKHFGDSFSFMPGNFIKIKVINKNTIKEGYILDSFINKKPVNFLKENLECSNDIDFDSRLENINNIFHEISNTLRDPNKSDKLRFYVENFNPSKYILNATLLVFSQLSKFYEYHKFTEIIDYLLQKGADINCKDKKGNTPILNIFRVNDHKKRHDYQFKFMSYLLDKGAKCYLDDTVNSWSLLTKSMVRVDVEFMKLLYAKGCDPNILYGTHIPLLFFLNNFGQFGCSKDFLYTAIYESIKHGYEINTKDLENGKTALFYVSEYGSGLEEVVKLLIKNGADVTIKDHAENTILDIIKQKRVHKPEEYYKQFYTEILE